MDDLQQTLIDIQDHLAPHLDGWEQMLYHYLFRHTCLSGRKTITIPARSVGLRLGRGRSGSSALSRNNIPRKLRSLEKKGAIKIHGRSSAGTEVEIVLPRNVPGLIREPESCDMIDLNNIDFFSTQENRQRIVARDGSQCRYCLRSVDAKTATVDHIIPQAAEGDNSYMNLITACFECNSRKHHQGAEDFLRGNYRAGVLSVEELNVCLEYLQQVRGGGVVPQ